MKYVQLKLTLWRNQDSMRSNNRNSGGMGFVDWLQLTFIILKIIGAIHWSWFWVLSPFWGWFLIAFILAMIS